MPITAVTNQTALMRQNPNYVQYANGVCYQAIAALENFNSALVDCEELEDELHNSLAGMNQVQQLLRGCVEGTGLSLD